MPSKDFLFFQRRPFQMNADASALEMAPILQALDPACDEIVLTLPARQKYMISFPQVSMIRIS